MRTRSRVLSAGMAAAFAVDGIAPHATRVCSGTVTVRVRRLRSTVSLRRAALSRDCLLSSRAVVARRRGALRVIVSFPGNDELLPVQTRRRVR